MKRIAVLALVTVAVVVASGVAIARIAISTDRSGRTVLVALDVSSGKQQWRIGLNTPMLSEPAIAGGTAVVLTGDGSVEARALTDGRLKWRVRSIKAQQSPPPVSGSSVFVVRNSGVLAALSTRTGVERWRSSRGRALTGVVLSANGAVIAVSEKGILLAFDATTGKPRWESSILGAAEVSLLLGPSVMSVGPFVAGDLVLVMTRDGVLHALEQRDGSQRWQIAVGQLSSTPVAADDTVVLGSSGLEGTRFMAVDARDGRERWRAENPEIFDQAVTVKHLVILLGGERRPGQLPPGGALSTAEARRLGISLNAVDPVDGTITWRATPTACCAPLSGAGVLVTTNVISEMISCLDPATGAERWATRLHLPGVLAMTGAAISKKTIVVVANEPD